MGEFKMARLVVNTLLVLSISCCVFSQIQDWIDENSLQLALRNVIKHVESSSNNFYAYKIGQVEVLDSENANEMNFTVHVNAVSTYCRKGVHFSELENCPINPDESVKECQLPVYRKKSS